MNKNEKIFTIGDKTTLGIITNFRLLNNEMMVDFDNKNSILLKSERLQHSKPPLFTTEDGVDIFKGDNYYHTTPKFTIEFGTNAKINSGNLIGLEGYKYFSTKEKAEEYIIMNKPCLSLKEISEVLNRNITRQKNYTDLEELVKIKLNK